MRDVLGSGPARRRWGAAMVLVGLAWSFAAAPCRAQGPTAELSPSDEIALHQSATLTLSVVVSEGARVEFVAPDDTWADWFLPYTPVRMETPLGDGRLRVSERRALDPLRPGAHDLGALAARVDGVSEEISGPVLRVRALTPEEGQDMARFEAIVFPFGPRPSLLTDWRLWLGLALAATAVVLYRFRAGRAAPMQEEVPKHPWQTARERLQALADRGWAENGVIAPYYVELSGILRDYLAGRFGLHAPEQTTPEFLSDEVGSRVLSQAQREMLARLLRHCDHVKFARYRPDAAEMLRRFDHVRGFVDQTAPEPPESEGGAS